MSLHTELRAEEERLLESGSLEEGREYPLPFAWDSDEAARLQHLSKEEKLEVASKWLSDANHFRHSFVMTTKQQRQAHSILHHNAIKLLRKLCLAYLLFLPLVEYPSVAHTHEAVIAIELFVYVLFALKLYLRYQMMGPSVFYDPWAVASCIMIPLSIIDTAVATTVTLNHMRLFRLSRVFYLAEDGRQLRSNIRFMTVSIIPVLARISTILFLYLSGFALVGMLLFPGSVQKKETEFGSFVDFVITLFVTLTTVNFPDVSFPLMREHAAYGLYFVLFLSCGIFLLLNVFLAQVFIAFKSFLRRDYDTKVDEAEKSINAIYWIMTNEGHLTEFHFTMLLRYAYPFLPTRRIHALFLQLDTSCKGTLSHTELYGLIALLRFDLEPEEKNSIARLLDQVAQSCTWRPLAVLCSMAQRLAGSRAYNAYWMLLLTASAMSGMIQAESYTGIEHRWYAMNVFFLVLYVIDLCIFVPSRGNRILTSLPTGLYAATLITYLALSAAQGINGHNALIVRCFLFPYVVFSFAPFSDLLSLSMSLLSPLVTNLISLVALIYIYAIVGMTLYHGKLDASNPLLEDTQFHHSGYPSIIGFDTFYQALYTCFHLMVVNNWNITMDACIAVTNAWSTAYFISYIILIPIVFLDIILAFFVHVYEHEAEERKKSDQQLPSTSLMEPFGGDYHSISPAINSPRHTLEEDGSLFEWKVRGRLHRTRGNRTVR